MHLDPLAEGVFFESGFGVTYIEARARWELQQLSPLE